jgi:large subunit ribosomal protein L31
MKEGIHPNYQVAQVRCACGHTFTTRSTIKEIRLEICANCHPFYTGRQKIMDTAGRMEKFEKRFAKTGGKTVVRKAQTAKAAPKVSKKKRKILSNTPRAVPPARPGKDKEPGKKTAASR